MATLLYQRQRQRIGRFFRKGTFLVGGGLVLLVVLMAVLGPPLIGGDPTAMDMAKRLHPPCNDHLFGTDEFGRDVLVRVVCGAPITLRIGAISVGIALLIGGVMGIAAGYFGGWLDLFLMALVDLLLAFPTLLLAMAIVTVLGPGLENTMIAVGLASAPAFARLVRGCALEVRSRVFVEAAHALGATDVAVMLRHIGPNILPPLLVLATLQFPAALLNSAALGFVGLGAQPPSPEWGAMLASARDYLRRAPWMVNFPGLAIMVTVLGFNLLGNALRDLLDPTQRHI